MIPCNEDLYLELNDGTLTGEVIAWNDKGWPMIRNRKQLVAIRPENVAVIRGNTTEYKTFSSFTPVQGLRGLFRDEAGELYERESIGWGVTRDGDITPVEQYAGEGITSMLEDPEYMCAFHESERERTYGENTSGVHQHAELLAAYSEMIN